MLAYFGEASCSLLQAILVTYSGNTVWWKKAYLHHDGGICNLHVEYGHCTVHHMYENVLNRVVQITKGLWVLLAIPYPTIRIMEDSGLVDWHEY